MQLKQKIIRIFLHVVGVVMLVNGIWMVSQALEWFINIPADMLATGQPNGHLIRDVGFAYIVFGFALNWCALELQNRRAVFLMIAFFMVAHAIGHAVEILIGLLPVSHWWIDLPLVLLPGLIFGVLALPRVWASMVGDGVRR